MTEDVVFLSCEPMFHGRSARFTQSDAGEVDRQPKVGNLRTSRSRTWTRKVRLVAWFPILVSVFFRGASACGQSQSNVKPTAQPKATASEHVGSLACAECHKEIYSKYAQTGMGRSISLVTLEFMHATGSSFSPSTSSTRTGRKCSATLANWIGSSEQGKTGSAAWSRRVTMY